MDMECVDGFGGVGVIIEICGVPLIQYLTKWINPTHNLFIDIQNSN
jgi:hypothetical protein